ncbi:MAG: hypothetical protein AB7G93_13835 [Bdellovibrionales bacterium]
MITVKWSETVILVLFMTLAGLGVGVSAKEDAEKVPHDVSDATCTWIKDKMECSGDKVPPKPKPRSKGKLPRPGSQPRVKG